MSNQIKFTQNFLHSKRLVESLVAKSQIQQGDTVLEIGPGKGIITIILVDKVGQGGQVIAIEFDNELFRNLKAVFTHLDANQIKLLNQNFLKFNLRSLPKDYKVFANIPFNITSEILEKLFTQKHAPSEAYLIMQKDALVNSRNKRQVGGTLKSLMILPFFDISTVYEFFKTDFKPSPSVDTCLFKFTRREKPLVKYDYMPAYLDFLTFVSKDRFGEGVWRKIFSKIEIHRLSKSDLVLQRGLKSQSFTGILAAFQLFLRKPDKYSIVWEATHKLRNQQKRMDKLNIEGHHHRSKRK